MNPRIKIIEKEGKKIIFVDQTGLNANEILAMTPEVTKLQIELKINLMLFDVSKTFFNSELKATGQDAISLVEREIGKKIYPALIGIKGIQKIIARAITKDIYFANDTDDAIDYLLKKASE